MLRLLTLNALFKGDVRLRLKALAGILERERYDVVCLQEVMYRANLRLLQRLAPSYVYTVASGAVLLKGGLVVLSRWPLSGYRFRTFARRPPARPEWLMRKGAQQVTARVHGTDVTIVNTHLSANRDDDWSPGNRYSLVAQAELAELAGTLGGDGPLVVTGDFNVPRPSPLLGAFRDAARLTDLMRDSDEPTYRPTPQWPNPPAFDHVLVRELAGTARLVFREPVAGSLYLSDHFGIDATVRLR